MAQKGPSWPLVLAQASGLPQSSLLSFIGQFPSSIKEENFSSCLKLPSYSCPPVSHLVSLSFFMRKLKLSKLRDFNFARCTPSLPPFFRKIFPPVQCLPLVLNYIPSHSNLGHSLINFGGGGGGCFLGGSDSRESAWNVGGLSSIPGSGRSLGEGNGYPLQYSSLENFMDRGTWRAIVHGVPKTQTQLNN